MKAIQVKLILAIFLIVSPIIALSQHQSETDLGIKDAIDILDSYLPAINHGRNKVLAEFDQLDKLNADEDLEIPEKQQQNIRKAVSAIKSSSNQGFFLIFRGREGYMKLISFMIYYEPGNYANTKFWILNPLYALNDGINEAIIFNLDEEPVIFATGLFEEGLYLPADSKPFYLIGIDCEITPPSIPGIPVFSSLIYTEIEDFTLLANCKLTGGNFPLGGAIIIRGGNMMFLANEICNNAASISGGGVVCNNMDSSSTPLLVANHIHHNIAVNGGGIAFGMDDGTMAILNLIEDNIGKDYGGGVYLEKSSSYVLFNKIYNNSTSRTSSDGGGISIKESKSSIIAGNYIENNSCKRRGGGIHCKGSDILPGSFVVIALNYILNNVSPFQGGGVAFEDDAEAVFVGNYVSNNSALFGAGISCWQSSIGFMANNINNNTAGDSNTHGQGGGLYLYEYTGITAANQITDNQAYFGGGIYFEAPSPKSGFGLYPTFGLNRIGKNKATWGGGIYVWGDNEPVFYNNSIYSNVADSAGGGLLFTDGTDAQMEGNNVYSNIAGKFGGGLYIRSSGTDPEIGPSKAIFGGSNHFQNNSALFGGGICYTAQSNPSINKNDFYGNTALYGGAIFVDETGGVLSGNFFDWNRANYNGGAVFVNKGNSPSIINNSFQRNIGGASVSPKMLAGNSPGGTKGNGDGGAIYTAGAGSHPVITGNILKRNVSNNGNGGGIAIKNESLPEIHDNIYEGNIAGYKLNGVGTGGAIFVQDCDITIRDETFLTNVAHTGGGIGIVDGSVDSILNNIFLINIADKDSLGSGSGGAVYIHGNQTTVQIGTKDDPNFFKYNTASFGGAIAAEINASITIHADSFVANQAGYFTGEGDGGAIFIRDGVSGQVGGNEPDGVGNFFKENTAGLPGLQGLANGGAIAVHDSTNMTLEGNLFIEHNACTHSGGAVYLKGEGVWADIGGENEGEIINAPFQQTQYGNIIQNNNNSKVHEFQMPVISWPAESDTMMVPDTLELDSLLEPPITPDTTWEDTIITVESVPIRPCITVDPGGGLNLYAYVTQGYGGVLLTNITSLIAPFAIDTILSNDYAWDGCMQGNYYCLADGAGGIRIFNMAPLYFGGQQVEVMSYSPGIEFYDVEADFNYIYAIGSDSNLYQFSIASGVITAIDTLFPPQGAYYSDIALANGFIYAVITHPVLTEFLVIQSTAIGLNYISTSVLDNFVSDFTVYTNFAFLGVYGISGDTTYAALKVLDVSNPLFIVDFPGFPDYKENHEYYSSIFIEGNELYIGANLGLIIHDMLLGGYMFTPTFRPVTDVVGWGPDAFISLSDPALAGFSPAAGGMLGDVPGIITEVDMELEWPAMLSFPPDSGWTPEIPVIPDTLYVGNDSIPVQGNTIKKGKYNNNNPVKLSAKSVTDTTLPVKDGLILTMNGGFLAVVDDAETKVLGNMIGGSDFDDGNSASHFGGAIYIKQAGDTVIIGSEDLSIPPLYIRNYIQGNIGRWGGGVALDRHIAGRVQLINNIIGGEAKLEGNLAKDRGGALYAQESKLDVSLNKIFRNYAGFDTLSRDTVYGFGGGLSFIKTDALVENNWIIRNTSAGNGGGIAIVLDGWKNVIRNNTLTENNGLANREPVSMIINYRADFDRPVTGLGDEVFLSKLSKGSLLADSCLILNNVIDHLGSFEASAIYTDTTLLMDSLLLNIKGNIIRSMIGFTGDGAIKDQALMDDNTIAIPLYTDPFAGNYSLASDFSFTGVGWNPAPGLSQMGDSVYMVPGDFPTITQALPVLKPGDRLIIMPGYNAENDSFPIMIPTAVAITGTAFGDTLNLNLTDSTIIEGESSKPVFFFDSTHCRTMIAGLKVMGGSKAVEMNNAEAYLLANIFCDNDSLDISAGFDEDLPFSFNDRIYFDHNTVTSPGLFLYKNSADHSDVFGNGNNERLLPGIIMGYNIMDYKVFSIHEFLPRICFGGEMNDFFKLTEDTLPQIFSTYDTIDVVESSRLNIELDPSFTNSPGNNFHLEKGSPCLLGLDSTYCIVLDGQCILGFDSVCICEIIIINGPDTLITYDTLSNCLYDWDTAIYSKVIGAQYANLSGDFKADTNSGCAPFTVVLMPDVEYADGADSLHYRWIFSNGDTVSGDTIVHILDVPGVYSVRMDVRGSYSMISEVKQDYLEVFANPAIDLGSDTVIIYGDSILLNGIITQGSPPYSFTWSPGTGLSDSTASQTWASPLDTVLYVLSIEDSKTCTASDSILIEVSEPLFSIAGRIFYANNDSTAIDLARIFLTEVYTGTKDSIMVDTAGRFRFNNIHGEYDLGFSVFENQGGVNSTDALLAARHFVNDITLTGIFEQAADVDASTYINSTDALLILRRFVMLLQSFPAGTWTYPEFSGITFESNGKDSIMVGVLCTGDVDGSYNLKGLKKAGLRLVRSADRHHSDMQSVNIYTMEAFEAGAISLVLAYPENMYEILDVSVEGADNKALFTTKNGILRISWYSLDAVNYEEDDLVLVISVALSDSYDPEKENLVFIAGSVIANNNAIEYESLFLKYTNPGNDEEYTFFLGQNYPNPHTGSTVIEYILPSEGMVTLEIFDNLGNRSMLIIDGIKAEGKHKVYLYNMILPCGVYQYRMTFSNDIESESATRRMVICR